MRSTLNLNFELVQAHINYECKQRSNTLKTNANIFSIYNNVGIIFSTNYVCCFPIQEKLILFLVYYFYNLLVFLLFMVLISYYLMDTLYVEKWATWLFIIIKEFSQLYIHPLYSVYCISKYYKNWWAPWRN